MRITIIILLIKDGQTDRWKTKYYRNWFACLYLPNHFHEFDPVVSEHPLVPPTGDLSKLTNVQKT